MIQSSATIQRRPVMSLATEMRDDPRSVIDVPATDVTKLFVQVGAAASADFLARLDVRFSVWCRTSQRWMPKVFAALLPIGVARPFRLPATGLTYDRLADDVAHHLQRDLRDVTLSLPTVDWDRSSGHYFSGAPDRSGLRHCAAGPPMTPFLCRPRHPDGVPQAATRTADNGASRWLPEWQWPQTRRRSSCPTHQTSLGLDPP